MSSFRLTNRPIIPPQLKVWVPSLGMEEITAQLPKKDRKSKKLNNNSALIQGCSTKLKYSPGLRWVHVAVVLLEIPNEDLNIRHPVKQIVFVGDCDGADPVHVRQAQTPPVAKSKFCTTAGKQPVSGPVNCSLGSIKKKCRRLRRSSGERHIWR